MSGDGARQVVRQVGQESREANHPSMHLAWNPCLHLGKTLTPSPFTNSDKQMAHSASPPASFISAEKTSVGKTDRDCTILPEEEEEEGEDGGRQRRR